MKIAFFMSTILEQGGGLEKYLIETASYLAQQKDFHVTIVTLDEDFTDRLNKILTFYYVSKTPVKTIKRESLESVKKKLGEATYKKVKNIELLRSELNNYDVIYSKNELIESFIFKFLIGYKNIPPVIFGVHTPHQYPIATSWHSKIHNLLYSSKLYNFLCSGVAAFHVSNKQSLCILEKQFKNIKVYLINYPFDAIDFKSKVDKNEYPLNVPQNRINILWLARLVEQKGVDDLFLLINEVNKYHKSRVNWYIAGSGDGRYEIQVKELAQSTDNIRVLGHVQNVQVPSLLSKMDLFISTSKWEVSPYNILEAQSMDKFVLAYDIPGPQDIILQDKTGKLCNNLTHMTSSLEDLIKSGDLKTLNRDIASSIVERFNTKRITSLLAEMFREIEKNNNYKLTIRLSDNSIC